MWRISCISTLLWMVACVAIPEQRTARDQVVFSPQQLRDDLKFIDTQLLSIHPEPFARLAITEYRKQYQSTYQNLSWPRNRQRYYEALLPLISKFQDTHIQLNFPDTEYNNFIKTKGEFPLTVLNTDNTLVVLSDNQGLPTVPVGAEIRTINKIPSSKLLAAMGQMVPAETESGRNRLVQVQFPRLLWSYFSGAIDYEIEFLWRGKVIKQKLTNAQLTELQLNSIQQRRQGSHYGVITVDNDTTMLWMNDFNERYDVFEEFLEQLFSDLRIQGKKNLILDLRYNEGGITDNLALLLSYLAPKSLNWADKASLKISAAFKRQHEQLIGHTKDEKYSRYLGWLPMEYLNFWQWEILFAENGEQFQTEIAPVLNKEERYFQGEVIVLSNGYCFSACAALVATLSKNDLATIIGEPPGSYVDTQYGYPVKIRLPNTGLVLTMPSMKFVLNKDADLKQVLEPDHSVKRRKMDVLMGRDIVFQAALELIRLRQE